MGGVCDGSCDEEWNAGLRCDAGYDIAFEIDGERTGFSPGAALIRLGRKDCTSPEHRALKSADLPGKIRHTGLKPLIDPPATVAI